MGINKQTQGISSSKLLSAKGIKRKKKKKEKEEEEEEEEEDPGLLHFEKPPLPPPQESLSLCDSLASHLRKPPKETQRKIHF